MIRELEYQRETLDVLSRYLDMLKEKKADANEAQIEANALAAKNSKIKIQVPDFTEESWKAMKEAGGLPPSRTNIPFQPHKDGTGRPVPNVTLKIPTGGGKTYLAVRGVSEIFGRYLHRNTGFVLWVVPNEAIYTQTLKNLKNQDHPYRRTLNTLAANRVQILERNDALRREDVTGRLCVMLLMLQASNRQNRESLKMFRDRGDVHGFFPDDSEREAHLALIDQVPNLDHYKDDMLGGIFASLGNALRIIRPVVVLDEGHRATSELARETLYGFNPGFVLELTATPDKKKAPPANVLVEVSGATLHDEGMIKMPINLDARQGTDWKVTLQAGVDVLNSLKAEAEQYRANTNRYIRPIMLVQVERTSKEQRESGHIHAEDVKARLMTTGFKEAEIAIKTADRNDLANPENQNLLSTTNRVRVIITKQALQEGWDCSFAYVLCSLAATSNKNAMTQLTGRILRQPHARKTGIKALDSCHVITHHTDTGEVVAAVKAGLEQSGLGDMEVNIGNSDGNTLAPDTRTIQRRDKFKALKIYLPRVMTGDGDNRRELDYATDILARLDWDDCKADTFAEKIPEDYQAAGNEMREINIGTAGVTSSTISASHENLYFNPVYATRQIADIVLNPFTGRAVVGECLKALDKKGIDTEKRDRMAGFITEQLRNHLMKVCNEKAETLFKANVENGTIQFYLHSGKEDWVMPDGMSIMAQKNERHLQDSNQNPLQLSLFQPVFEKELNDYEQKIALYLDGKQTIKWWHRNVAGKHYYLRGWQRHKVYPDFVFAKGETGNSFVVIETKGDQLAGNLDTEYKRKLMDYLTEKFNWNRAQSVGELEIGDDTKFTAKLVLMNEWEAELAELIQ